MIYILYRLFQLSSKKAGIPMEITAKGFFAGTLTRDIERSGPFFDLPNPVYENVKQYAIVKKEWEYA